MSDATQLIRAALDSGVELRFVDGRLQVTGRRKAVTSWAPRLRQHKNELLAVLTPPVPMAQCEAARIYHQHHFSCTTCCAAGKGYGLRCGTGRVLWASYQKKPNT